jgi:uncharacterized protein YcnI
MRAPHSPQSPGRARSWPRRLGAAAVLGVVATLAFPPDAFAHVSVSPDKAVPGEPATLSFLVPNERDDAATVRLEVTFPAGQSVGSATPQNLPGWRVDVHKQMTGQPAGAGDEMDEGTVSSIVWEGGTVPAGTYQEFPVTIGKTPERGPLVFTAIQTYSDGAVVRWADQPQPGQPEPEHPAPMVTVAPVAPADAGAESTSDTTARVLGGAGLAIGVASLGVAFARRRSTRADPATAEAAAEPDEIRL